MNKEQAQKSLHQAVQAVAAEREGRTAIAIQSVAMQGPLPHPSILIEYNKAIPDGAQRIFAMAEREQLHSHEIDRAAMALVGRGQVLGYTLIGLISAGGLVLVGMGREISGFATFFSALGTLIWGGFVTRKSKKPKAKPPQDPKG